MSAFASGDPDALEAFADATQHLAERQRRLTRQFDLAIEAVRRQHRSFASAASTARSLRQISTSYDELATEALRTAQAFRNADSVLSSLGGSSYANAGSPPWHVDVPMPGQDWGFSWQMPGLPFAEWSRVTERVRLGLEAGVGPRVDGGIGIAVVNGLLQIGVDLEAKVGAWARAAVASGFGPFLATASGELFVGATADAEGAVSIGRNGVAARGEAGVFAGGKAEGEVGLDVGPVGVGASGAVTVGVGAKAEGDAAFGWDRIGIRYDLGVTFGLGFEIGGEWHVRPRDVFHGMVDLGESAMNVPVVRASVDIASSAFDTGTGLVGDAAGLGFDVAGSAFETGADVFGSGIDKAASVGRRLGGWLS